MARPTLDETEEIEIQTRTKELTEVWVGYDRENSRKYQKHYFKTFVTKTQKSIKMIVTYHARLNYDISKILVITNITIFWLFELPE